MKKEEFAMQAAEKIQARGFDSQIATKPVPNGEPEVGVYIREKGSAVGICVYLPSPWNEEPAPGQLEAFVEKGIGAFEASKETSSSIADAADELRLDIDRVFPMIVRADWNEELLKDVPHRLIGGDLGMFYYMDMSKVVGCPATSRITWPIANREGLSEEDLYQAAVANAAKETTFLPLGDVMSSLLGADVGMPALDMGPDDGGLYVLSNRSAFRGAGGIVSFAATHQDKAWWYIPSSVHEWLVASKAITSREDLSEMIREINATQVDPVDRLSDHPYEARDFLAS